VKDSYEASTNFDYAVNHDRAAVSDDSAGNRTMNCSLFYSLGLVGVVLSEGNAHRTRLLYGRLFIRR